jgi:hypothetical protein
MGPVETAGNFSLKPDPICPRRNDKLDQFKCSIFYFYFLTAVPAYDHRVGNLQIQSQGNRRGFWKIIEIKI